MIAVRVEQVGAVAVITIDRPERRNAIDRETAQQLAAALDNFETSDNARVAVLTGAGGSFSAGMDLKALEETGERPHTASRGMFGIVERPPDKPLIAAIEGFALGGGLELALCCDLIVSASDARFGLPEVSRGLVAGAGGLIRLPRRIPYGDALELVLTGGTIDARRAHQLGLVSHLSEPGGALELATSLADRIAANAPLAVAAAKTIIAEVERLPIAKAFEAQEPHVERVRSSDDAREGTLAFVEKRQPVWRGR